MCEVQADEEVHYEEHHHKDDSVREKRKTAFNIYAFMPKKFRQSILVGAQNYMCALYVDIVIPGRTTVSPGTRIQAMVVTQVQLDILFVKINGLLPIV